MISNRCAEDAVAAQVRCSVCYAGTDYFEEAYSPAREAIAAWNNRAANDLSADRDALVAEIVAWLPEQPPHLSLQEYADAIAAKWGARP